MKLIFFGVLWMATNVFANACINYFFETSRAYQNIQTLIKETVSVGTQSDVSLVPSKAKDVLVAAMNLITRANPESTVYIFTPNMQVDGIGSAFLTNMISRTYKYGRNGKRDDVKFKIHFSDPNVFMPKSQYVGLLQISSSIEVRSLSQSSALVEIPEGMTLVVAETSQGLQYVLFEGSLVRKSLKTDNVVRLPVRLQYAHTLAAGSFKSNIPFAKGTLSAETQESFLQALDSTSSQYGLLDKKGYKKAATESEQLQVERRAYEFVVQLYFEILKESPQFSKVQNESPSPTVTADSEGVAIEAELKTEPTVDFATLEILQQLSIRIP